MPWNARTLRTLRERRGLTQQQVADLVGVHRVTIVKIENEKLKPGVDLLESLAKVLRVPVTKLLKP